MIYIIRHGQTVLNKKHLLQGRSNADLDEEGILQAGEAAERLKRLGISIDRIYSSPLTRAVKTAQLLSREAELTIDDRLIEMDYGPYEGMDLMNPAPEVMAFFMDFEGVAAPDGMEQLPDVVARLGEFLEEIREEAKEKNILISTHAIAMKGALEYLSPESKGSYWPKNIGNCDIYAAAVIDGEYEVPYELKEH